MDMIDGGRMPGESPRRRRYDSPQPRWGAFQRRRWGGCPLSKAGLLVIAAMILVAGFAVGTGRAAENARDDESAPETREVLDVVHAWNRAFARNDVPTYFSYIDDAITVITPSNPYRTEGVVHDRQEFEYMLRLGAGRLGYFQELQPRVQRYGDVAIVTYHSRGSYGPEGKEQTLYLKETDVLVKKAAGWKVVHIHVSRTEAP